ncbi:hypothetical protein E8D34_08345 [Nocardioides sp. GY 10113]|uniref:FKBP-type peptidyl-prolyl cis-trans isomerase n=1 Tax=Nocardioides sp. GY 10113 TaxID=2569761 RepID=UPI0010A8AAD0|nr:FKBP-type peptidyl-prolyl cis-trans isomerase [Nocardioides sp. GY 10113]TIC87683.1 hypothetical protein E8D34_08345 [Nocardioides sp. GY 10113]
MLSRLPRSFRRPTALVIAPALALSLAACGSDDSDGAEGFDAVEVSGDFGTTPTFDFSDQLVAGEEEQKTLIEGDGPEVADGDQVLVQYTVADGFTEDVVLDTYDQETTGFLATVGGEAAQPQVASDLFTGYLSGLIDDGMTVGTRFAVTVGVPQAFADYTTAFTDYGIGNEDGLVFVVDLASLAAPTGTEKKAPAWAPTVVEKDGVPASLDFKGTPKPSGDLEVATLVKGDGPVVKSGQTILVNYLGQVYKGKKPFDESFSRSGGLSAVVGGKQASVVKGWSKGLVGQTVGSRVLLEIPPALGYGDQKQGDSIPANSTLYFVVDIADAANTPAPAATEAPTE